MAEFKDSKGNAWEITLPIGTITRVKSKSDGKFNLFEPEENELRQQLCNDFGLFWELLWYLVEPQAERKGINAEQFGELMAAPCIAEARIKFFAEWTSFFQGLQRHEVAGTLETTMELLETAKKKVLARLPQIIQQEKTKAEAAIDAALNKHFGN